MRDGDVPSERATPPELVADRFVRIGGSQAVDLATGEVILLRWSTHETRSAQHAWAGRCASLFSVRHPAVVPLVDYGVVAGQSRVQVWATSGLRWRGDRLAALMAVESAVKFLHEVHMSAGSPSLDRIVETACGPALLPDDSTGDGPLEGDIEQQESAAWHRLIRSTIGPWKTPDASRLFGVRLQPRTVMAPFVDWLESSHVHGPRRIYLCGARRSGLTTELNLLAREARLRGFVPLNVDAAVKLRHMVPQSDLLPGVLAGRHLLLIVEQADPSAVRQTHATRAAMAKWLIHLGQSSARSHAVVVVTHIPKANAPLLSLAALSESALRRMVAGASLEETKLMAAIRASDGLPGRLMHHLAPPCAAAAVAELAPPYGDVERLPRSVGSSELPRVADCAPARDRFDRACRLMVAGRHAEAERLLRESACAWSRRGDHRSAGLASMTLGHLLLRRGRIDDATRSFQGAKAAFERVEDERGMGCAAWSLGLCLTDSGALREAEAVLRSAVIVLDEAEASRDRSIAELALARCLFWQDRLPEATVLVRKLLELDWTHTEVSTDPLDPLVGVWALRTRIAVLERDLPSATAAARHAAALAGARDAVVESQAHAAMALALDAIGDGEGLQERIARGLAAARRARAPLMAVRLRVILCQSHLGESAVCRSAVRCLSRMRIEKLPTLLAARVRLALSRRIADQRAKRALAESARRFITDSGAKVLERLASLSPATPPATHSTYSSTPVIRDVIDMLSACQEAGDERAALGRLGWLVRERTRASSVAVFGVESAGLTILATAGSRPERSAAAQRAIDSGLLIRPDRSANAIEAAAPVRYGAATVGAVFCRWTADGPDDVERTESLLTAAAVACAPSVRLALDRLALPSRVAAQEPDLVGVSEATRELRRAIARTAGAPFTSLIEGESGSGKELVAKAIHRLSVRRGRKFCPLNCAALTDELLEAELFGHARGAFTGAHIDRAGLFEETHGGTLFLDEVGELSARAQAKLLRVLQEGEIRRVGESTPRAVDVRVIAATNRPLADLVTAGRFRQDLFYRLNVIRIAVPPLRSRVDDIPILAAHFWGQACQRLGSQATLAPATLAALVQYPWPGNVRELQNVLATVAVSVPRRGSVGPTALPSSIGGPSQDETPITLDEARRDFERRFVKTALARAGGSRSRAAHSLGLSRQGLVKLVARLEIDERGT